MCVESEVKQASHVQSTQSYEERRLKNSIKHHQQISFPGTLRTTCSFIFITAHSTTVYFKKSDRYRNSVLQAVARAGPRTPPGSFIISQEGKTSNCIQNQSSHFYFLLTPTPLLHLRDSEMLWRDCTDIFHFWGGLVVVFFFVLLLVKFDQRPMAVFTVERFYIFPPSHTNYYKQSPF